MSFLLTSDIHMTDKPIDEHRWGLFAWLEAQANDKDVDEIIFLGDYTDAKDRHSAKLVNRFTHHIRLLARKYKIYMLEANHDYVDPVHPFFEFLSDPEWTHVEFITKPTEVDLLSGDSALFLPNSRDYKTDWAELIFTQLDYIFCHQTFEGALSENGFPLPGIPTDVFGSTKAKIYSGDIHAPGKVGPVEYVGSPYRTSFGSNFTPRVLYVDDSNLATDLYFPCPNRHTVTIRTLKDLNSYYKTVKVGDQVKIRVRMRREDLHEYPQLRDDVREEIVKRQWVECGFELAELVPSKKKDEPSDMQKVFRTPEQLVREFSEKHDLTKDQEELGVSLLAI